MTANFTHVNSCKLCSSKDLKKVLELAKSPIGDKYTPPDKANESKELYSLDIMMCQFCKHYQNGRWWYTYDRPTLGTHAYSE